LPTIGDEASDEIDQEIEGAGMLNLRNVLELVVDGFNNSPMTQEQSVGVEHELVFHIFAQLGEELEGVLREALKK
jgi:hypothetical protein